MATNVNDFPDLVVDSTATIANGATTSSIITCRGTSLASITLPAAFTGTTLQFDGSLDGTNFSRIYDLDTNAAISYTVTQGRYYAVPDLSLFVGFPFIKLVSGSSEAADRTIHVGLRRFV